MPPRVTIPHKPKTAIVSSEESINKKWEVTCQRLKKRLSEVNTELLRLYHDIGQQVLSITTHPASWGSRTIEDFSDRLDVSKHTIAAACRFSQTVTKYELDMLVKHGIRWAAAIALIVVKDPRDRYSLCEAYSKNQWTTDRLREEIHKLLPEELQDKPKSHGGLNPTTCFNKTASQASELGITLPQYIEYFQYYAQIDPANRSDKAKEAYRKSVEHLKYLESEIKKALDSVSEKQ